MLLLFTAGGCTPQILCTPTQNPHRLSTGGRSWCSSSVHMSAGIVSRVGKILGCYFYFWRSLVLPAFSVSVGASESTGVIGWAFYFASWYDVGLQEERKESSAGISESYRAPITNPWGASDGSRGHVDLIITQVSPSTYDTYTVVYL